MSQKNNSLRCALASGEQYLAGQGIPDCAIDAWLLLEYVTGISRASFLADRDRAIEGADLARYEELIRQRGDHVPLQQITGQQEFMGLTFQVNKHVLVPRQDTETLVEEALSQLGPGMRILDLCTGSGCIAVSLAKLGPGVTVDASDLSGEALEVARENGRRLGVQVRWLQGDLFEPVSRASRPAEAAGGQNGYDMIVSNPPYIRTAVIEELSEEVRLHEPRLALDGREDGLYFYRRIAAEAKRFLRPGGRLLLEIGYDQGMAVSSLLKAEGYRDVAVLKDLAGCDRVVTCQSGGSSIDSRE